MESEAYEMVTRGADSEYLHIEHVRQPRQRVPVARMPRAESPDDCAPRQAAGHVSVLTHKRGIVDGYEAEMPDRRVDDNCDRNQGRREPQDLPE